ncbi:alpha/beta fold hydrolase [Massilia sp. W12]|uniref:alpha/beta fold hydrolase n=1 Tax=Massilia sp. W12 TaxID=3126507 RepID=UPI0030D414EB
MPDTARLIATARLTLCCRQAGAGAPLLLIGGTGWDLREPPSSFERSLQQHWRVIRHDQRGQGRSDMPDCRYTMADYADDCAALLDALGHVRVPVVGISFGGMVAQEFALRHPQRVARLVLACTSSGGAGGHSHPLHELQHLPAADYARRFLQLANLRRDAAWQQANADLFAAMVQVMQMGREALDAPARDGLARQLQARKMHNCWERLPQIAAPTLVCGGIDDGICPPPNLENIARSIPGAQLQMFSGGHGFYMEDQRVLPAVKAFLAHAA